MPKLFITNKKTDTEAVTIPRSIRDALQWKRGDNLVIILGKDRSVIIKKKEDFQKELEVEA